MGQPYLSIAAKDNLQKPRLLEASGASSGIRTPDTLLKRQVLYLLS